MIYGFFGFLSCAKGCSGGIKRDLERSYITL
jgi:hypothetical protein